MKEQSLFASVSDELAHCPTV